MNDINQQVKELKQNVELLVNSNKLDEAKALIDSYQKIVPNDPDIYSISAVISIIEGNLEMAEEVIHNGLKLDDNNFDLLFNMAYLYEQKDEYNKALIYYKRARKLRLLESIIKVEIDNIIGNIVEHQENKIKIEYKYNKIYKYLNKIQNVLFIDTNLSVDVNILAQKIDRYGINVDLAYCGQRPDLKFSSKELIYGKILALTNIEDLIDYINFYSYDIVHLFNISNDLKTYFKQKCKVPISTNYELIRQDIEVVLKNYFNISLNSLNKQNWRNYTENGKDLTILIPTYNRPTTFKRTIDYFMNFKKITPNIIILDSSSELNKKIIEEKVLDMKNNRLFYYSFDTAIHIHSKITKGLKLVKTPYVALCADDDFLTEEGLILSLETLREDSSFFSVKGKNLFFYDKTYRLIEYDFFEGLTQENIIDRLFSYVKGYACTLQFQVFRTQIIKELYTYIDINMDKAPFNSTFAEYCFYLMLAITGKICKLNVDLNIRDKSIEREQTVKNFNDAIIERNFNENYKMFFNFLNDYYKTIKNNKNLEQNLKTIFINFLINFLKVPKENIVYEDDQFNLTQLEIGMKQSWIWPREIKD